MSVPLPYVCGVTHRSQKRVSVHLELELQAVVRYLMWMLGIELRSSARAIHALSYLLSHLSDLLKWILAENMSFGLRIPVFWFL